MLVFCAHNDDQILGPGGSLIKYAKEGKVVKTYVFSYGETSHMHLKEEVVKQMRVEEVYESDRIMGGSGVFFFGLKVGKFRQGFKEKELDKKVKDIIKKEKPSKIFTHSLDDPHPDHRAVFSLITGILDAMKFKGDVYCFNVWNPVNFRRRDSPKLVVDTSETFNTKIKAFLAHKSQKMTIISLLWSVYLRDWWNGWRNNYKFAEVFYKVR